MERRRHRSRVIPAMLVMAMAMTPGITPLMAQAAQTVASPFVATPPVIDGSISYSEFTSAGFDLPHGRLSVVNDAARLYLRLNMTGDRTNDPAWGNGGGGDFFWVTFDVNGDGLITPNVDRNYGLAPSQPHMLFSYYLGAHQFTPVQSGLIGSSWAPGFGCFIGDGSLSLTLSPFSFSCSSHRVHEFAFDLAEIGGTLGGHVRMGVRVASGGSTSFDDQEPAGFGGNFSDLIDVTLGSSPTPLPAASAGASVGLTSTPLELTQAVQTPTNTLTLVANKATVGRIYPLVTGSSSAQPSVVYLHAHRGGLPMPGSPLAAFVSATSSPDRAQLAGIGNLALPRAWLTGQVAFRARVRDGHGTVTSSSEVVRTFVPRRVPNFWTVPLNTGTTSNPSLVSTDWIDATESFSRASIPVPGINFLRRPHTVIPPISGYSPAKGVDAVDAYFDEVVAAWAWSVLLGGGAPYSLPEQIYGITSSGGGLSDPVWIGGRGFAAAGARTHRGTMAHEMNHNFDRSTTGTWGKHPGGCGADGPYADWPYPDDKIQEVGFDTRAPWAQTSTQRTVIPASTPDLMSYCTSSVLPTKWPSPYRFQGQLSTFPTTNSTFSEARAALRMLFVSGSLREDGTGSLDEVLVQPGLKFFRMSGRYAIDLIGGDGELLSSRAFHAAFVDPEGGARSTVRFSVQIPEPAGVASVVLRNGSEILDRIVVSGNTPEVRVTSPNGGEQLPSGTFTASWEGSDADGDVLTYSLMYSPDGGRAWFPVASGLTESSVDVDTRALPGGSASLLRVIATDGYNTAFDDSDGVFGVALTPPTVQIYSPEGGGVFGMGEGIALQGDGHDATGAPIDEERIFWSVADEFIAQGRSAQVVLPVGVHVITLTVVDANDLITQTSVTIRVGGTCADRGHPYDEDGLVSEPVHGTVEPLVPPAEDTVHAINCDIIRANNL